MRISLMRHAETWANREQRMLGQRDAVLTEEHPRELTPQGYQQAIALGKRLSRGPAPNCIYASPQTRCQETLDAIQQTVDGPWSLQYDERLKEIDLGCFSGLTWPEAQTRYPELCQTLMSQLEWHPIPEAEAPQQSRDRATAFMEDCLQNHGRDEQIWILSHGGILNHLIASLLGSDRSWEIAAASAALFEFEIDRDRWQSCPEQLNTSLWKILCFNDTSHSQPPPIS